jgi:hypothetical protein|nr:MAG TPA: hypothetical protein [Caudoviricetes sp.]
MRSDFPPPQVLRSEAQIAQHGIAVINASVRVNDEDKGMHEVTIHQSASKDAAGRLATNDGFSNSGATITWDLPMGATPDFVSQSVSADRPNFADKFSIPYLGDNVEIFLHKSPASNTKQYYSKVFTGRVSANKIDSATGGLVTECVDYIDNLSKVVEVLPLAYIMPGRRRTDNKRFYPNASLSYFIWDILEQCGYSPAAKSKLPLDENRQVLLYAPLQGSFMCNWRRGHGQLIGASGGSKWGDAGTPIFTFYHGEGTAYLTRGHATYETANGHNKTYSKGRPLILRGKNSYGRSGDTWINIYCEKGNDKDAARFGILADGSIALDTVEKPMKLAPGARFELKIEGNRWRVDQENGEYANGTLPDTRLRDGGNLYAVEIYASQGGHIADVLLLNGDLPFQDRTLARISTPSHSLSLQFTRSVRGRVAREVLEEVAEYFSCMMWHDSDGALNIVNVPRIIKDNPTMRIDADEIISVDVTQDSTKLASSVNVSYNIAEWSRMGSTGNDAPVTFWQGSGGSLEPSERRTTWFSPSDTEEWFETDTELNVDFFYLYTIDRIPNHGVDPEFDAHARKLYHGSVAEYVWEKGFIEAHYEAYIDDITPWQWVLHEVNPSTTNAIQARFPTQREAHGMMEDLAGKPTPIIRGGLKIDFSKNRNIARFTTTPAAQKMPALELDIGSWGDTQNNAHAIAQDIAAMAKSQIQIPSLTIFFRPDIKIGETYIVELPSGGNLNVIITGVTHVPADNQTRITCRVF